MMMSPNLLISIHTASATTSVSVSPSPPSGLSLFLILCYVATKVPSFPPFCLCPLLCFLSLLLHFFFFCVWVPHFFSQIFSIVLVFELNADLGMSYFLHFLFCFSKWVSYFCFVFLMWFWVPINYTILCEILLNVEDSGSSICFGIWVLFGCWENVGKEKGMTVLKVWIFSFLFSVCFIFLLTIYGTPLDKNLHFTEL